MAKNKYYVVWNGSNAGVFDSWSACEKAVKGEKGILFKGFPDRQSAEKAFKMGYGAYKKYGVEEKAWQNISSASKPIVPSIAVDAACSGNPGKMEYRGVFVETGTQVFKSCVYEGGTNNIGEFLAIVHCLAWQQQNKLTYPIYSDSVNGMKWVSMKTCNTKLIENEKNKPLFEVVRRAEAWLRTNSFRLPIYKWKTEEWGEVPADFGRK
jgi:Predicted double-stranded RNA/RNA-DNA hybrid binding protein